MNSPPSKPLVCEATPLPLVEKISTPSPVPLLVTEISPLEVEPVNVSALVKVFAEASAGTFVVSRFSVVLPPNETEPPPVRSVPAVILTAEFCSMALVTPAVFTLNVTSPLVPPPLRPDPAVTPVIVPVPAAAQFQLVPLYCRT